MLIRIRRPIAEATNQLMCAGLLCLAAGCATRKPVPQDYAVFPPPPDEPRIQFLTSFGKETDLGGRGSFADFIVGRDRWLRPIWKPYGIASTKGKIYVCDTQAGNVGIADLVKRRLRYVRPTGRGAFGLPFNIAVDKDGTFYVTDTKRLQVLIFNGDGTFAGELGKGTEMKPCGIALGGDRLYVTDLSNHCVRVYNKTSRELLFEVPRNPAEEKGKLFSPTNVTLDEQGRIYVSDSGGFAVQIYDAEGNHLRTIGEIGLTPGRFALPKGIGVDREGRIYVVDAATQLVQVFDSEGRVLMYFGYPQTSGPGGMWLPAGLAIDYENVDLYRKYAAPGYQIEFLILVVNQVGPQKVSIYGFLRRT
jgi:sugar lactone lactonase YvrE